MGNVQKVVAKGVADRRHRVHADADDVLHALRTSTHCGRRFHRL